MEINRSELLAALSAVKPALNDKSTMDELACVWFEDGAVSAYNDVIGIQVPVDTFFTGGLRGSLVTGLMETATSDRVDIAIKGEKITMKAGSAKINLAMLPSRRQIWHAPEVNDDAWFKPSATFIQALERVMVSTVKASSVPDQMGVTFILHDNGLSLYSTDNGTISWGQVGIDDFPDIPVDRALVPTVFCDQLLKMGAGKEDAAVELAFLKNAAMAKVGDRLLFGRYLESQNPVPFPSIVRRYLQDGDDDRLLDLPPGLPLALDRASVLLSKGGQGLSVEFQASDKSLRLYTRTAYGTLDETLELDDFHEEAVMKLNPKLVGRAIPHVRTFMLGQQAAVFASEGYYHLIAPVTEGQKED